MLGVAAKLKIAAILRPVRACRHEMCVMAILVPVTHAQSADGFRYHTPSNTALRCAPVSTYTNQYDMPCMGTESLACILCSDARPSGPLQSGAMPLPCLTSVIGNVEYEGQGHSRPSRSIGLLCAGCVTNHTMLQDDQSDSPGQGKNLSASMHSDAEKEHLQSPILSGHKHGSQECTVVRERLTGVAGVRPKLAPAMDVTARASGTSLLRYWPVRDPSVCAYTLAASAAKATRATAVLLTILTPCLHASNQVRCQHEQAMSCKPRLRSFSTSCSFP